MIPCLRYPEAMAAIDWLCKVFGFTEHMVVGEPSGRVAHAQLTLDGGMIMLGSTGGSSAYGDLIAQPGEIGGRETQTTYVVVKDADAVLARVLAGGGEVLMPIKNEDYGGRGFTCRDPQGHIWSVGTYDPWA